MQEDDDTSIKQDLCYEFWWVYRGLSRRIGGIFEMLLW